MEEITIKIDGRTLAVPRGITILEAARKAGIDIPTLCYMKEINEIGACRMCVVEVAGVKTLVTACVYPCDRDGMEIRTNNKRVIEARKKTLQLMLSNHNCNCLSCLRSGRCELQNLARKYAIETTERYAGDKTPSKIDSSAVHMIRDNSKCILCRRCVAVCKEVQGIGVIGANMRGFKTHIGSPFKMGLGETSCVSCGQCIAVCPTGALQEKHYINEVFEALNDPNKIVLVQAAPAVRAALGECFGYPIGTDVQGKLAAALRRLGFDKVFDTNFGADLTIMEESNEFIERMKQRKNLPLITSCSPGWVKYCEHYYPEMTDNLSSCKAPQQMFGAVAKSYWAEKMGVDPKRIVMVSVMPCTAKKFEITRPDENANGVPDVDIVLTTRELGRMIECAGIEFDQLPDEDFDAPLGSGTGAAVIFGTTGGVMEAALRTAVEKLTGESAPSVEFQEVRGVEGIKEASYEIAGVGVVRVAVASGLVNARTLLDRVRNGEAEYQFIEIMGCPGGCVNGGGQPQVPYSVRNFVDIRAERAKVLYDLDAKNPLRKSHENPDIQELYKNYLGEPGSERAHHLLHTTYIKRMINQAV